MKTFVAICALSLSAIGCISNLTSRGSFASLHDLVKQTLADSADCGPIKMNEKGGNRYFEIKPQPRGLLVTVYERPFFNQTEWERRYDARTNQISQFMEWAKTDPKIDINHPDPKIVERFSGITNWFGLFELPEWHYQKTGIDVSVQELDDAYDGSDKDAAEANKRYGEVVKLLEPYNRANKMLQPAATVTSILTNK